MSDAIKLLSKQDNILLSTDVAGGQNNTFIGTAKVVLFNPEQMLDNGNPITLKDISVKAEGDSYESAYINSLNKAVALLGLGE